MPVSHREENVVDYLWDKFKAWRRGEKRWTKMGVTRGRIYIKKGEDASDFAWRPRPNKVISARTSRRR